LLQLKLTLHTKERKGKVTQKLNFDQQREAETVSEKPRN